MGATPVLNARRILVGRAIVHGRHRLELTQGQLARQLGIDPRQLSEWERGIHEPGDRHLAELMHALGQPMGFFYTEH